MSKYVSFYVRVSGTPPCGMRSAEGVYKVRHIPHDRTLEQLAGEAIQVVSEHAPFAAEARGSYTYMVFDSNGDSIEQISHRTEPDFCYTDYCGRANDYPESITMH